MAKRNHTMTQSRCCMVFLIVIGHILLNNEFIEARKIASVKNAELVKHKGTVKTIKVTLTKQHYLITFLLNLYWYPNRSGVPLERVSLIRFNHNIIMIVVYVFRAKMVMSLTVSISTNNLLSIIHFSRIIQ